MRNSKIGSVPSYSSCGNYNAYGAKDLALPSTNSAEIDLGFSNTNNQVAGVDEADIVKTDGRNIYIVSGSTMVILQAYPPESAKVLSRISLYGYAKPWSDTKHYCERFLFNFEDD